MKKLLILLVLLLSATAFSQRKYDFLVHEDTVFQLNDTVNAEPMLQFTLNPLSIWTGNYIEQSLDGPNFAGNLLDVNARIFYKRMGLNLHYIASKKYYPELEYKDKYYGVSKESFLDMGFMLDFRIKSYEKRQFKTYKNFYLEKKPENHPFKSSKLTRQFYNWSLCAGISVFNYANPQLVSQDLTSSVLMSDTYFINKYTADYMTGSKQLRFLFGVRLDKLMNARLTSDKSMARNYSRLSGFFNVVYLMNEDRKFARLENYDMDNYQNSHTQSDGKEHEDQFRIRSNKLGINSGIDYTWGKKGNLLLWHAGFDFTLNPAYRYHVIYDYHPVKLSDIENYPYYNYSIEYDETVYTCYFRWKLGFTICAK
ncbi:MAG: hypothetical protein K0R65_410 [Crocinitomicaceae bacterium]|jgi:hypothetical protein|nr:hypothetical protein [Crocinitomicaceae bacterium]